MTENISSAVEKLMQAKGLRNALWSMLLLFLALFIFESLTQYFATNSLQARVEIVSALSEITSTEANSDSISVMHGELVQEAVTLNQNLNNPASFIFEGIIRFIKGAYISFPLFYLIFRIVVSVFKRITDDSHKRIALMLSSIGLSFATWLATILGILSVILNTSHSLFISWFVFPFISLALFIPFAVWLALVRITMPSAKKNEPMKVSGVKHVEDQE